MGKNALIFLFCLKSCKHVVFMNVSTAVEENCLSKFVFKLTIQLLRLASLSWSSHIRNPMLLSTRSHMSLAWSYGHIAKLHFATAPVIIIVGGWLFKKKMVGNNFFSNDWESANCWWMFWLLYKKSKICTKFTYFFHCMMFISLV